MDAEDRIREIETLIREEARRQVRYDNATRGVWRAIAFPIGQEPGFIAGPLEGTGPSKLEAAEAMLADWRSRQAPR